MRQNRAIFLERPVTPFDGDIDTMRMIEARFL